MKTSYAYLIYHELNCNKNPWQNVPPKINELNMSKQKNNNILFNIEKIKENILY